MKRKYIVIQLLLACTSTPLWAQQGKIEKVERYHKSMRFHEENRYAENLEKKDPPSTTLGMLAEGAMELENPIDAEKWYAKALEKEPNNSEYMLNYAEALRQNKKYEESAKWMDKYKQSKPSDRRGTVHNKIEEFLLSPEANAERFFINEQQGLNSNNNELCALTNGDELYFISDRSRLKLIGRIDQRNNRRYLSVYKAEPASKIKRSKIKPIIRDSRFHYGPMVISKDNVAYITRSSQEKRKLTRDTEGKVHLELIRSKQTSKGKWQDFEKLSISDINYSVGHPALSVDGKQLYFVSDMPGGYGGTDIYVVAINEDGSLGKPVNLGDEINTEGNEMFPSIAPDGALFFSSDGHSGFGGLDLYRSRAKGESFSSPMNLGKTINSSRDDFSLYYASDSSGYFTSNRGDIGRDNVFQFAQLMPFEITRILNGIALNQDGDIIPNAWVTLYDDKGNEIKKIQSDEHGNYSFELEDEGNYSLHGKKDEYRDGTSTFSIGDDEENITQNVVLESIESSFLALLITDTENGKPIDGCTVELTNKTTGVTETFNTNSEGGYKKLLEAIDIGETLNFSIHIEKEGYLSKSVDYKKLMDQPGIYNVHEDIDLSLTAVGIGSDLGELIDINPIYFDLAKYNIRNDAALELDKIVQVMNENPSMIIELGSHTDSRGSDYSNLRLSDKRAKSSAEYIKKRITNPERISGKGYGETQLTNKCGDGIRCSEQEHQANRRTEFKIIKM